jgi:SAM-dependent methyltransferase
LHRAATGQDADLVAEDDTGRTRRLDVARWGAAALAGDDGLVRRCTAATLDVGCGAGRLTAAVAARGVPALGVDISPDAVRIARRRGVPAMRCDVFGAVPGRGRWRRLILADGNVGIGGDPVRLLGRCRELIAPHGRVLVEVDRPGTGTWRGRIQLRDPATGGTSRAFPWAYVDADSLAAMAGAAALRVCLQWTEAGRWFASLATA